MNMIIAINVIILRWNDGLLPILEAPEIGCPDMFVIFLSFCSLLPV